jgi:hypothetical protein
MGQAIAKEISTMRLLLVCILGVAVSSACRRKSVPPPVAPTVVSANAKEPTLGELNDAVQAWFTARGQAPASFEELAKAQFISKVPTPPPGRTYVIDAPNIRVILR